MKNSGSDVLLKELTSGAEVNDDLKLLLMNTFCAIYQMVQGLESKDLSKGNDG